MPYYAMPGFVQRSQPRLHATIATMVLGMAMTGCSRPAPAPSAEQVYHQYCASCHGAEARGDGPLADALKRRPTDLTRLASRAGGFDERAVLATIDGRRHVREHGPRDMPVWGAVFEEGLRADDKRYPGFTALLTGRALVEYLRGLQKK